MMLVFSVVSVFLTSFLLLFLGGFLILLCFYQFFYFDKKKMV